MSFDLQAPPVKLNPNELQEWCWRLWYWLQRLQMNQNLVESTTWNAGEIAADAEEAKEVTVTGAALGDFAVAALSIDIADLQLSADVTAANTVTCVLSNSTGGAIDLASATLYVMVIKRQE